MTDANHALLLQDALRPDAVVDLQTQSKQAALEVLLQHLASRPEVTDQRALAEAIFRRESMMSTGIGCGLAVPHTRINAVTDLIMTVGVSRDGILDYDSLDGAPVRLVFMIAAREDQHADHLCLLAAVSRRLRDSTLRERLVDAPSPKAFCELLWQPPAVC